MWVRVREIKSVISKRLSELKASVIVAPDDVCLVSNLTCVTLEHAKPHVPSCNLPIVRASDVVTMFPSSCPHHTFHPVAQFYGDVELDDDTDVGYVRHVVAKRKQLQFEYCLRGSRHG